MDLTPRVPKPATRPTPAPRAHASASDGEGRPGAPLPPARRAAAVRPGGRLIGAALAAALLALPLPVAGEETVLDLAWSRLEAGGELLGGRVARDDDPRAPERLEIAGSDGAASTAPVLRLEDPPITRSVYAITGEVSHEDVEGDGYLELWSYFEDGGMYFSRTLGDSGPLGSLRGSSGWRTFVLPFRNAPDGPPPTRLEMNVVLPGGGTVRLASLRLVQYEDAEAPLGVAAWWSPRTGGLLGGIAGTLLGCLGAAIGILAGRRASRGLVMGLNALLAACTAPLLVAGVAAVASGQPYAVFYPLLLAGGIGTLLSGVMFAVLRQRYAALELRRMRSLDA